MPKADLSDMLASAGGSARRRAAPRKQEPLPPVREGKAPKQASRLNTVPLTVHYPKEVRDSLKILAIEQGKTLHQLMAEFINDGFAKHGRPEICPADGSGE